MKKPIEEIKEIVNSSKTEQECLNEMRNKKLIVSMSQGRRYWNSLKKPEEKKK